jgi:short-subunit dehydrogenase
VALVTGASRGIGPHIARALAREGAALALLARRAGDLEQVAAALRETGARVLALPADVTAGDARRAALARLEAELGPLDVLVNNAGVESEGPFADLDADTIARTIRLNVEAPIQLTREVLPGMLARGRGHVVQIASLAGRKGPPYDALYSGTKAAIIEWTNALRIELRGTGVGLSSVLPSYVTGEGMFARFGVKPPALVGSCTPQQVAAAVVRAIRRDKAEIIVNSLPVRPFLALYALAPGVFDWLLTATGITARQREKIGRR